MSRREISGRLLPQQGILSPQRLERNEPVSNHRLTYKAISVSESVIKIGGLLFLFAFAGYEKFERPRQFFGHVLERFLRCHSAYKLKPNRQKCDQSLSYLFLCRLGQGLDYEHTLHDIDLDGGRELYLYETIKSAYRYRFHFVSTRQKLYLYYSSRQRTSHNKG